MPTDGEDLTIWTVYDHPLDRPDVFLAREWRIVLGAPEPVRTERTFQSQDLDEVRVFLEDLGGFRLARSPEDDPKIIESWI